MRFGFMFRAALAAALVLGLAVPPAMAAPVSVRLVLAKKIYRPPIDVANGLTLAYGDSRTANGGGIAVSATQYTIDSTFAAGWAGHLSGVTDNAILLRDSWMYGIGAQTSAGIRARQSSLNFRCNDATAATTNFCYSGVRIAHSGTAASGQPVLTFASTTGVVAGMYVNGPNPGFANIPAGTTVLSATSTTVTMSANLTGSITNTQLVNFSPAAAQNRFDLYLGGGAGFGITDPVGNRLSTGVFSPCTDPAKAVTFLAGVNDSGLSTTQSLTNLAAMLDGFGPSSGCDKLVFAGDEVPTGLATAFSEQRTIGAGPFTSTVTNSATFYDDVRVAYAPDLTNGGAGVPNTRSAGDGTLLTKVASAPAAGEYSVAAGVYTFNTADSGKKVAISYRYTASGATSAAQVTRNEWFNSATCGDFTSSATGSPITYTGITGAKCNRPWVVVVPTWAATVDGATGSLYYPKAYVSGDGLHPNTFGGRAIAQAFATAMTPYVGASKITAPTSNNILFGGNSASSTAAGTGTCTGVGNNTANYFLTSVSPNTNTGLYAVGQALYMSAASGIPAGTLIDCVDMTNNRIHMAAPATSIQTNGSSVARGDANSLMANGLMDDAHAAATAITNCSSKCGTPSGATQLVPTNWTAALTANDKTAIDNGLLQVDYGIVPNGFAAGIDSFKIQVSGRASAGAHAFSLTGNTQTVMRALITAGDKLRATCKVRIGAGPNGRLTGLGGLPLTLAVTTSAYTPFSGGPSTVTSASGRVGAGGTGVVWTDADIVSADVVVPQVTPTLDTTGTTISNIQLTIAFNADSGALVSYTAEVGQCDFRKVTL